MTDEHSEKLNVLTFEITPGRHASVSPCVDGKDLLTEWGLGGPWMPLSYHAVVVPLLALDDIYYQCETVSIAGFFVGSCVCGITRCGGVSCDITLELGEMVWENFGITGVGPFRFSWDQVTAELRRARETYRSAFD